MFFLSTKKHVLYIFQGCKWFESKTKRVITKDVKTVTYSCLNFRYTIIVRISKGNVRANTMRNVLFLHAQLWPPDKGRAIEGLVVCNSWNYKIFAKTRKI